MGAAMASFAYFFLDISMRSECRPRLEGRGVIIRAALSQHADGGQTTGNCNAHLDASAKSTDISKPIASRQGKNEYSWWQLDDVGRRMQEDQRCGWKPGLDSSRNRKPHSHITNRETQTYLISNAESWRWNLRLLSSSVLIMAVSRLTVGFPVVDKSEFSRNHF